VELTEECCLQLTLPIVVCVEGLEDSVQALKEEGLKVVQWAKLPHAIGNISCIVVVWLNNTGSIELVPLLIQ
jgi:hypothetical protein